MPHCISPSGHVDGEWHTGPPLDPLIPCCSWDEGLKAGNSETCNDFSPAHPNGGFRGTDYFYAQSGGHGCACTTQQVHETLMWSPRRCVLPAFNASRVCQLLYNRTLVFVGDSTSDQAATAFINSIRAGYGAPDLDVKSNAPVGCGSTIRFELSDTLIGQKFGDYNRGRTWLEIAKSLNPERDIMVISGGPHIHSTPNFQRVLAAVVSDHELFFPKLHLLWRSQFPGGCGLKPLTEFPDDSFWAQYLSSGREIFSYADHRVWDTLALPLFSNLSANRAFIDISPLYLRPDSHVGSMPGAAFPRDCLHLCLPGPLHPFFAQILLHVLESLGLDD